MEKLLTTKEAAELLGVSVKTLQDWAREGKIPVTRLPGNDYRFSAPVLDSWLEKRTTKARAYSSVNAAKALHALVLIIGLAFLLTSCARPLGACYENGYAGYGHAPRVDHGKHRTSY